MGFKEYVDSYPSYHRHPANKTLHLVGIPLIIVGAVFILTSRWALGGALVLTGSVFLGVGHRIEGNKPALQKNPIYILAAPIWYVQTLWRLVTRRNPDARHMPSCSTASDRHDSRGHEPR